MRIFLLFLLSLSLLCCDKKVGPPGEQGPKGIDGRDTTRLTAPGTIFGKVTEQKYNSQPVGSADCTVLLAGTTFSATSDATGSYTIQNVPAGIYDIHLQKTGFGMARIQQISFPGNGNLKVNGLIAQKSNYEFVSGYLKDTLSNLGLRALKLYLIIPDTLGSVNCAVLLGRTPEIDPEDPGTFVISFYRSANGFLAPNTILLDISSPYLLPTYFSKGTTVYAKAYPAGYGIGNYQDKVSPKLVIPTCGKPLGPAYAFVF